MENKYYKSLLVSTYAPPTLAGAPRFMANLLEHFPPESYTILTSFYNIDNTSAKIGTWLPGDYVFYDNPNASKSTRQQQKALPTEAVNNPVVRLKKFLRNTFIFPLWVKAPLSAAVKMDLVAKLKRYLKRNNFVKTLLGAPLILGQIPLIIRQGCKTVRNKNIELIVGFSDYGPAMVGTYHIHRITKVPFYLYMFDLYKGNFLPFTGSLLAMIYEPLLFKAAKKIVVTNPGTKEFYLKRYGDSMANKIEVIFNSTNPEPYLKWQTAIAPHPAPYTILFTGSVYWAQARSLTDLIEAIDGMPDLDIKLKIYSPNPPEYLRSIGMTSPRIEFSVAPGSEMPSIQSKADILFLPLAWHTKGPEIINTATPGKLTDYLIAGRPILVHSPAESHLAQYTKANGVAKVVDTEDIAALQIAIRQLLFDYEFCHNLVDNAKKLFFANHDLSKNVAKFESLLIKTN